VIPVLDLKAGRVVLASRGRRETYAPLPASVLVPAGPADDAVTLAHVFRELARQQLVRARKAVLLNVLGI